MARYFFNIADAYPAIPCGGQEIESIAAARRCALLYAGRLLSEQGPEFWDQGEWVMTVSDENRLTLFTINVSTCDAPAVSG